MNSFIGRMSKIILLSQFTVLLVKFLLKLTLERSKQVLAYFLPVFLFFFLIKNIRFFQIVKIGQRSECVLKNKKSLLLLMQT